MRHLATARFWRCYQALPKTVREQADRSFAQLRADPAHRALHFRRSASFDPRVSGCTIGRWLATLVGLVLVAGAAATAATVAVAFGSYLSDLANVPVWLAAVALLAAATALCVFGLRESTWVNIVFTLIEVGGLVLSSSRSARARRSAVLRRERVARPPLHL